MLTITLSTNLLQSILIHLDLNFTWLIPNFISSISSVRLSDLSNARLSPMVKLYFDETGSIFNLSQDIVMILNFSSKSTLLTSKAMTENML